MLLAYPLWYQFAGPQHYSGLPDFVLGYGTDLASYPAFAKLSLLGQAAADANLAPNPEENTFFGWPLLLGLLVIVVLAVAPGRRAGAGRSSRCCSWCCRWARR